MNFKFSALTLRLFQRDDDEENGFLITKGSMGLRLRALHGMNMCDSNCAGELSPGNTFAPARIVIAESASEPTVEEDQIKLFLKSHQ